MSLDHDLQNLPRLTDADREALDDDYSVMPRLVSDEAIARRDAAHAARLGDGITVSLLLNLAADLLNEADEANHSGHPITEALQRQARAVLAEALERCELEQAGHVQYRAAESMNTINSRAEDVGCNHREV